MCGIAGILGPESAAVAESDLWAMASALTHRGPDSSGVWTAPGIGVAHTRLSLLDLSDAGRQPWVEGGDALVFNGEIYNFVEMRARLQQRGHRFSSTSDTEVLFASLQMDGVDETLRTIRGMFAFAYHEGSTRTTVLVRDRYGIKPLVYMATAHGVVFASEVKALMTVAEPRIDETLALLALRTLGDKFQRRTLFSDVQQVAAAGVVSVRDGRVVAQRSYEPLLNSIDEARYRRLERSTFGDVCDEFGHLLGRSVARMRVADAPLGAFLSGGTDSGLILALAAQGRDGLRAFTSDVVGPGSERCATEATAQHVGVPLAVSEFNPSDWITDWVSATWFLETPVITNPSAVPFRRVAALAHEHAYKAVLTGEGADELFLGYPRLASGGLERVAGAPISALRRVYGRVPGLLDAVLNERDWVSSEFIKGIAGGFEEVALEHEAADRYAFVGGEESARMHALSARMVQASLQALLQRNDRMGMAASIESRFPFLDEDVVAFALNLPVKWKLRRTRRVHDPKHPFVIDKAPVRALTARHLGREVADRHKSGFATPGLRGVRIRKGAFRDGWSSAAFGGGDSFDRQIDEWPQHYDSAKLLSVEIFGRLFGWRQAIDEVDEYVRSVVCVL